MVNKYSFLVSQPVLYAELDVRLAAEYKETYILNVSILPKKGGRKVHFSPMPDVSPQTYTGNNCTKLEPGDGTITSCENVKNSKIQNKEDVISKNQDSVNKSLIAQEILKLSYLYDSVREIVTHKWQGMITEGFINSIRHTLIVYKGPIVNSHRNLLTILKRSDQQSIDLRNVRIAYLHAHKCVKLLQYLLELLSSSKDLSGGPLLNNIFDHIPDVDIDIKFPLHDIFLKSTQPLIKMVYHWIKYGLILDPYGEFFIFLNSNCLEMHFWQSQFLLRKHLIPKMIQPTVGKIILEMGKSEVFLRKHCREHTELQSVVDLLKRFESGKDLLNGENQDLLCLFRRPYEETCSLVFNTMDKKFKILQHFQVLYNYILLNKGNFVWCFMKLVNKEMNKNVGSVNVRALNSLLESALKNSSAATDNEYTSRIYISFKSTFSDDFLEDVFRLQYKMTGPFRIIFQVSEGIYNKLFTFLWQSKLMDFRLSEIWISLLSLSRSYAPCNDYTFLFNKLFMVCSKLIHFNKQLQHFIAYDVLERYWLEFLNEYRSTNSIENLIQSHARFLNSLALETMQVTSLKSLSLKLSMIFSLVQDVEAVVKQIYLLPDRNKTNMITSSKAHDLIKANIAIISKTFEIIIIEFLKNIQSSQCYDGLNKLAEKINYNRFYIKDEQLQLKLSLIRKRKLHKFTNN